MDTDHPVVGPDGYSNLLSADNLPLIGMFIGKKNIIAGFSLQITVLITIFAFTADTNKSAKSAGAPASKTGAPIFSDSNEGTCGSFGCHTEFDINAGSGILSVKTDNEAYSFNEKDTITFLVSLIDSGYEKFGFQGVVIDNNYNAAGEIKLIDPVRSQILNSTRSSGPLQGRKYVTHTLDGTVSTSPNTGSWTFQWIAPDSAISSVTLYVAALSANSNYEMDGDYVYTTNLTLSDTTINDIENLSQPVVRIYPNPTKGTMFIQPGSNAEELKLELEIFSLNGTLIYTQSIRGECEIDLSKMSVKNGAFIYHLRSTNITGKTGKLIYLP
jgi:hypothetical protein